MRYSHVVKSVSWDDLENLRPMEVIIFKDPDSIELIMEFAEANKSKIKCVCSKVGQYDYATYFKPVKTRKRSWHKPANLSPEFMEDQLFRVNGGDKVTADQLRERIFDSFAATMPEKLSPKYDHMIEDDGE